MMRRWALRAALAQRGVLAAAHPPTAVRRSSAAAAVPRASPAATRTAGVNAVGGEAAASNSSSATMTTTANNVILDLSRLLNDRRIALESALERSSPPTEVARAAAALRKALEEMLPKQTRDWCRLRTVVVEADGTSDADCFTDVRKSTLFVTVLAVHKAMEVLIKSSRAANKDQSGANSRVNTPLVLRSVVDLCALCTEAESKMVTREWGVVINLLALLVGELRFHNRNSTDVGPTQQVLALLGSAAKAHADVEPTGFPQREMASFTTLLQWLGGATVVNAEGLDRFVCVFEDVVRFASQCFVVAPASFLAAACSQLSRVALTRLPEVADGSVDVRHDHGGAVSHRERFASAKVELFRSVAKRVGATAWSKVPRHETVVVLLAIERFLGSLDAKALSAQILSDVAQLLSAVCHDAKTETLQACTDAKDTAAALRTCSTAIAAGTLTLDVAQDFIQTELDVASASRTRIATSWLPLMQAIAGIAIHTTSDAARATLLENCLADIDATSASFVELHAAVDDATATALTFLPQLAQRFFVDGAAWTTESQRAWLCAAAGRDAAAAMPGHPIVKVLSDLSDVVQRRYFAVLRFAKLVAVSEASKWPVLRQSLVGGVKLAVLQPCEDAPVFAFETIREAATHLCGVCNEGSEGCLAVARVAADIVTSVLDEPTVIKAVDASGTFRQDVSTVLVLLLRALKDAPSLTVDPATVFTVVGIVHTLSGRDGCGTLHPTLWEALVDITATLSDSEAATSLSGRGSVRDTWAALISFAPPQANPALLERAATFVEQFVRLKLNAEQELRTKAFKEHLVECSRLGRAAEAITEQTQFAIPPSLAVMLCDARNEMFAGFERVVDLPDKPSELRNARRAIFSAASVAGAFASRTLTAPLTPEAKRGLRRFVQVLEALGNLDLATNDRLSLVRAVDNLTRAYGAATTNAAESSTPEADNDARAAAKALAETAAKLRSVAAIAVSTVATKSVASSVKRRKDKAESRAARSGSDVEDDIASSSPQAEKSPLSVLAHTVGAAYRARAFSGPAWLSLLREIQGALSRKEPVPVSVLVSALAHVRVDAVAGLLENADIDTIEMSIRAIVAAAVNSDVNDASSVSSKNIGAVAQTALRLNLFSDAAALTTAFLKNFDAAATSARLDDQPTTALLRVVDFVCTAIEAEAEDDAAGDDDGSVASAPQAPQVQEFDWDVLAKLGDCAFEVLKTSLTAVSGDDVMLPLRHVSLVLRLRTVLTAAAPPGWTASGLCDPKNTAALTFDAMMPRLRDELAKPSADAMELLAAATEWLDEARTLAQVTACAAVVARSLQRLCSPTTTAVDAASPLHVSLAEVAKATLQIKRTPRAARRAYLDRDANKALASLMSRVMSLDSRDITTDVRATIEADVLPVLLSTCAFKLTRDVDDRRALTTSAGDAVPRRVKLTVPLDGALRYLHGSSSALAAAQCLKLPGCNVNALLAAIVVNVHCSMTKLTRPKQFDRAVSLLLVVDHVLSWLLDSASPPVAASWRAAMTQVDISRLPSVSVAAVKKNASWQVGAAKLKLEAATRITSAIKTPSDTAAPPPPPSFRDDVTALVQRAEAALNTLEGRQSSVRESSSAAAILTTAKTTFSAATNTDCPTLLLEALVDAMTLAEQVATRTLPTASAPQRALMRSLIGRSHLTKVVSSDFAQRLAE